MAAEANQVEPIPVARADDLDLDREEDRAEWHRRLAAQATTRLATSLKRLQQLGIVDDNGNVVSGEAPPDMHASSDTTLETG